MLLYIFSILYDRCHILPLNLYIFLEDNILGKLCHGKNNKVYDHLNPKNMTSKLMLPLVAWGNGIVMIAIFAVVCVVLVGVVLAMMSADKKKKE